MRSVVNSHAKYRLRLITLRGTARRDDIARDVRFAVTDRVTVPQRRRYARVQVALALRVLPLSAEGAPDGDPIETRTRDLSADVRGMGRRRRRRVDPHHLHLAPQRRERGLVHRRGRPVVDDDHLVVVGRDSLLVAR